MKMEGEITLDKREGKRKVSVNALQTIRPILIIFDEVNFINGKICKAPEKRRWGIW